MCILHPKVIFQVHSVCRIWGRQDDAHSVVCTMKQNEPCACCLLRTEQASSSLCYPRVLCDLLPAPALEGSVHPWIPTQVLNTTSPQMVTAAGGGARVGAQRLQWDRLQCNWMEEGPNISRNWVDLQKGSFVPPTHSDLVGVTCDPEVATEFRMLVFCVSFSILTTTSPRLDWDFLSETDL